MKDINKFFSQSLRWVGFEALSYQLLLLGHQLLLFRITDYKTYGLIGATFSLLYLFVAIADFGLEMSISPFFSTIKRSRRLFRKFFITQSLPNILAVAACTGVFFALSFIFPTLLGLSHINHSFFLVLAATILSEMLKKPLRTAMHLAFLNKPVAFIEVGTIILYIVSVWGLYFAGFSVSPMLALIPMLVASWLSVAAMVWWLYRFSQSLPHETSREPEGLKTRIKKSRSFNALNQMTHLLFSSNFLVPFFALQFGLAHAGVFKLVSHVAYCLTSILRKTFGLTSDALLAKTKEMAIHAKREVFLRVTQKLHHALYGIIIFFALNYGKIAAYKQVTEKPIPGSVIYLFLIICLSENLFIAYEKFYITQEKSGHLLIFNVITMALTYATIQSVIGASELVALLSIVAIRIAMFGLLSGFSFYTWKIKPQWKPQPKYLVAALGTAVGFFLFF